VANATDREAKEFGMPRIILFMACTLATLSMTTSSANADKPLSYPNTRRVDHVDIYHGVKVPDPYRWLEDDVRTSKEVADWVAAENKVTFAYLNAIPEREAILRRVRELWNYEKYSVPFKAGGRYFYTKNNGLQNQSVLYVQDSLDGSPRLLLDPNTWSNDGTVALTGLSVSDDGRYLAFSKSEAGSDWRGWHVLEVATGKQLADDVRWAKFSEASWTPDSRGFFYSRFEEPTAGAKFQSLNFNQKVFYHRLGGPQTDDVLVYQRPDHPDWGFAAHVTEDGRYLVITTWKGTDPKNRVTYKDLAEPYGLPVELIDDLTNEFNFVGNDGPVFYFKTDLEAPRGRVIAIDLRQPARVNWKEIIPQAPENLGGVNLVGNLLVAHYLKDVKTQIKMFEPGGKFVREVSLPSIGVASGFAGRRADTETFYSFSSFNRPPTMYRYDLITGASSVFREPRVAFNPDDYEVKQVFYSSRDGTKVPMFIAHKKGIKLDGKNPTLMYGYGGFNIPLTPAFSISNLVWMEMGGVYAQPNIRGGGEYGKEWHQAAVKLKRQTAYDDFLAAAQWLVDHQVTRPSKLAIKGGSNGGLLVGAALTQRPDLFGAALPAVGVMDMLRFHKFTAGRYWVDDYGSSDNPQEFKALYAYSPYHNLKKGTRYPATLVTTADTDDRVVPSHSFKFIAALQYAQAAAAPVLARIETRAGHGAGRPTAQILEEVADQWAFLVKNLDMKLPKQ
jgi:prolyl oligopeptidase